MANSSMLHVRMDDDLKREAVDALAAMGLSASDAVRMLFRRIAADKTFPLELKVPNDETRAALLEGRRLIEEHRLRFDSYDDLMDALEQEAGK